MSSHANRLYLEPMAFLDQIENGSAPEERAQARHQTCLRRPVCVFAFGEAARGRARCPRAGRVAASRTRRPVARGQRGSRPRDTKYLETAARTFPRPHADGLSTAVHDASESRHALCKAVAPHLQTAARPVRTHPSAARLSAACRSALSALFHCCRTTVPAPQQDPPSPPAPTPALGDCLRPRLYASAKLPFDIVRARYSPRDTPAGKEEATLGFLQTNRPIPRPSQ